MATRKRRFRKTSLWLLVMFLLGSGLMLVALTQNVAVTRLGKTATREMTTESVQRANQAAQGKTAPFNYAKTSQLNPLTVAGYGLQELTGNSQYGAVGQLRVPAVGLDLPIGVGVSNAVLVRGAGTLKADQRMGQGNYALAGHYMTAQRLLFSPLKGVRQGNSVYLTDKRQVYCYRVTRVRVVDRHRVDVIDEVPGKRLVTLVTCASAKRGEPKRLVVQGELQSVTRERV
ncbi:class A sortase [Levilactobacillus hammesii]|uniref:Sortase n=1 Tax=Levilactobacillus hammesii DSM 16381 TaxID=1423753 RepID=A0A0R1V8G0_9LACO|nr:class A sortase [Levilactobacillus hammesii]KRL98203.1 sortase [Levilactobacillus hammesii DSM 16381]